MAPPYQEELLAFTDAGVRFVVVGAVALGLHKYPRATADLDILPSLDADNLSKIIDIMTSLGFKPRVPVDPREMLDPAKRESWYRDKHLQVFPFFREGRPPRMVDVMIYPPIAYDEVAAHQHDVVLESRTIYIASPEDLLLMKKSAMRAKDLSDIAILEDAIAQQNPKKREKPDE